MSGGSFTIMNSAFTNNSAVQDGGVMLTFGGSHIILSSTFASNIAGRNGGITATVGVSFTYMNCTSDNVQWQSSQLRRSCVCC